MINFSQVISIRRAYENNNPNIKERCKTHNLQSRKEIIGIMNYKVAFPT